jgi:hypothetical protein
MRCAVCAYDYANVEHVYLAYNTDIFYGWKCEVTNYAMYKYEHVCMYVYDIWRL